MARADDRVAYVGGNILGANLNNTAYSSASKTAIQNALSDSTNKITARVSVAHGDEAGAGADYVKVKFFRNNFPLALYKSKNYVQSDAKNFINEVMTDVGLTPTAAPAPTGLTATAAGANTINLSWTSGGGNTVDYAVYRGGTQVGTTTNTTYSDTGLTASTAYSYTVRARDAAGGESANSNTATATTTA